ncbi:hypothetical protein F2Q68_00045550 [Brassica cretica]|uniref:Uncharacterized protein n=1 Tax=Brassica cretica TaxID=69181 RepID=A0A8S9LJ08_BRACR|nr:hypothetical protein F2Q68_00045550 [Brassica cretica]
MLLKVEGYAWLRFSLLKPFSDVKFVCLCVCVFVFRLCVWVALGFEALMDWGLSENWGRVCFTFSLCLGCSSSFESVFWCAAQYLTGSAVGSYFFHRICCALRFRYLLSVASSPSSVRWCSTLELMVGMVHGEAAILWCHVVPWFKSTGFSGFFGKGLWSFGSIAFGLSSLIVNRLPNQLLGWRSVFS